MVSRIRGLDSPGGIVVNREGVRRGNYSDPKPKEGSYLGEVW